MNIQRNSRAWLLLGFMGILWGLSFSLAKMSTEGGAHPLGINYWCCLVGAAVLISGSIILRRPLPLRRDVLIVCTVCGVLGSVIPGTAYFYAASRLSPGVLSITIATVPLMTFLAAAILGVERVSTARLLGVFLGILSIGLLIGPSTSLPDRSAVPWVLLAVGSALCYTAENLFVAMRMPTDVNVYTLVGGMFLVATIIMTPLVIITGTFEPLPWPWGRSEWAILGMAAITVSAYGMFLYLVIYAGPVFASQTAYVVTLSGVLWGIMIFNDEHSLWVWLSLGVMMLALALVTPRKDNSQPATSLEHVNKP
ncbi:MAG: DMT family transporter [Arenicellales bacterium]|nr:DMT family transporter [Arenicellales bacterium]